VGGTKNPDVDAVVALRPDLVVVNDEENRIEDARALAAGGLRLHSMSPRAVAEVGPAVVALAGAVGVPAPSRFTEPEWSQWLAARRDGARGGRTAAVLVWRRPWMTLAADTYGSSVLELLGIGNVWGAAPDRYPEVALADLAALRPSLVVLPHEPYAFGERHVPEVEAALAPARAVLVDGRDLFWWGTRTPDAVSRLEVSLAG
jgi:ABC-type hemin transport system substrate-binding protein